MLNTLQEYRMAIPFTLTFRILTRFLGLAASTLLPCTLVLAAPVADERLVFSGQVAAEKPHRFADVILTGDVITSTLAMSVPAEDVGKTADQFLVAIIRESQGTRLYMQVNGKWLTWNGRVADLVPARRGVLDATENFKVLTAEPLFEGSYRVYAGYKEDGGQLRYMAKAFNFGVQDETSESLVRFSSDTAMLDYLRDGMSVASTEEKYYSSVDFVGITADSAGLPASAVTSVAGAESAASRTSGTNLQEAGVDEGDTIKVAGDLLYMLGTCKESACLQVQQLDSTRATSELLGSYSFDQAATPSSMYLVEGEGGNDTVVTLASQGYYGGWYRIWGWGQSNTTLEFLAVDASSNISQNEKLSIDGAMIASRRVGDTLYLVTRYTPAIAGYEIYTLDTVKEKANEQVLKEVPLTEFLPHVETSKEDLLALIQSKNCYLPTSAVDGGRDPSIITITSIPLQAPADFSSTCFLGGSEALYMTTDSLYLATTSWDYDVLAADALFYSPEHTTSIHKFALADGGVEYRGSGAVKGHLGWSEDKKSFRMGQNGDFLNVVTSVGDTWNGSSSTRLNVLRESVTDNLLETVSVVDGIGKPGEQLYAARFMGDRAYLVTFRLTDPLYVLDLSDQTRPLIAGELEISGYSEYLHPVSDTLLLGIGKEAIADDSSSDFGGGRGAWYQGLKVALFDVADPAHPAEITSLEIGKRGTESDVLWDHHAFSFVPATASEPARFAIPVQLHDTVPVWEGFDPGKVNAWYEYTSTALYSFEVSQLGISQAGILVGEVAPPQTKSSGSDAVVVIVAGSSGEGTTKPETDPAASSQLSLLPNDRLFAPIYVHYDGRSVLMDEAVFYIHSGKVLGSFWGESK